MIFPDLFHRARRRSAEAAHARKVANKAKRRQAMLWIRDRSLARAATEFRQRLREGDWDRALAIGLDIGARAEAREDRTLLDEICRTIGRLGAHGSAADMKLAHRHLIQGRRADEWMGEDISDKTLLIDLMETEKQGISTALHHATALAQVTKKTSHCTVVVERRLVPLFSRTFPMVETRAADLDDKHDYPSAGRFAGIEHLSVLFERDEKTMLDNFHPLKANRLLAEQLREQYRQAGGDRPLIGIAWGSSAFGKDLPPLSAWRSLVEAVDATYISLQYGDIHSDLPEIFGGNDGRIICDTSVDQMADLDRFAAQIAALDAVVSISNTTAHMAGALGINSVVALGDVYTRFWPLSTNSTPYYPYTTLVKRTQRSWEATMFEAVSQLSSMVGSTPRGQSSDE
jgi:hypothetical protein